MRVLSEVGGRGRAVGPWRAFSFWSHEVLVTGMWPHPAIVYREVEARDLFSLVVAEPAFLALKHQTTGHLRLHSFLFSQLTAWHTCPGVCWLSRLFAIPGLPHLSSQGWSVDECRGGWIGSCLFPALFRARHSGNMEAENSANTVFTPFQMTQCPSCSATSPGPSLWELV